MKSVQEMNNVVASSYSKRKSSGVEDKNTKSTKTVFSDTPASSSSSSSATAVKLPIDVVNEKLTIVLEKHKCDGFMNVSESDEDDEEDKDSEEYEYGKTLTEEEAQAMRFILMNNAREKAVNAGFEFVTSGQQDDGCMMFNTTNGNEVGFGLVNEVEKALKMKKKSDKFNALFGLTHALKTFDFWLHDNECGGEGEELDDGVTALAKAWKTILKLSNEDLGIDEEFTRPGIEYLLNSFEKFIIAESPVPYDFLWK